MTKNKKGESAFFHGVPNSKSALMCENDPSDERDVP